MFIASVSFLITFMGVRMLVHRIVNHEGHIQWVMVHGMHIHHLVWGILILLLVGYGWLLDLGRSHSPMSIFFSRLMAVSYGVGAALTLDEFALWLNLEPDAYWTREGRLSIDAVILFGAPAGGGGVGRAVLPRGCSEMWHGRAAGRQRARDARARRFAAGGCFVGVKFGDHRRVSRSEDAALELHRGSELAGLLGPLFGHDAEALEGLKVGQGAVDFADDLAIEGNDAADRPPVRRANRRGCRAAAPNLQERRSWAR